MSARSEELSLLNWFLAIPNDKDVSRSLSDLKAVVTSRGGGHWHLSRVPLKELRVGTIDNLLLLSENVGRVDAMARSLVQKIHRTYLELEGEYAPALDVFTNPIHSYINSFEWDAGKFNPRDKLPDLVRGIQSHLEKTAERLRNNHTKLQETKAQKSAIERKKAGSMMTRPIRQYVDSSKFKDGDYILSALVVVPIAKLDAFLKGYEWLEETDANLRLRKAAQKKLEQKRKIEAEVVRRKAAVGEDAVGGEAADDSKEAEGSELPTVNLFESHGTRTVVPDSVCELHRDKECVLLQVEVIRAGLHWFSGVCREMGLVVREFSFDVDTDKDDDRRLGELKALEDEQSKRLKLLCRTTFSDAFSRFIHLKLVRVFVEAVLRYGLPVDFSVSVVRPHRGAEKSLLQVLNTRYAHLVDKALQAPAADSEVDFSGVGSDFYPFVYIQLKVDLF